MRLILSILVLCLCFTASNASALPEMAIFVDAGEPQTICYGETLDLDLLGASISGDVSDGVWFTSGDGIFLPGGNSNEIFSVAEQYQPGPQDQADGSFTLILVSDDPDGNGPMVEVSDQVVISFMTAPALVCNNSINISLAESCEQEVNIFMLLANPSEPYDKYWIELQDEGGNIIPNNILNVIHLGTTVEFTVGHACTNNTCNGEITVSDNIPPFLSCFESEEIDCEFGLSPEVVGFPVPFYADVTSIGENTYLVENFDACSDVTLTYVDTEVEMACASTGYVKEVTRDWLAEDESGNTSSCTQTILVNPLPISEVMSPPDYDGTDEPPLDCDGDWEALPNGHPSPESTGMPDFVDCGNIETTFSDVYFEQCGAGFKIVRQWFVIDWCTSESFNVNQIIKILDLEGPVFECPEDLTISSQAYECLSLDFELMPVDSVYDCSDYSFSYKVYTLDTFDISSLYINDNTIEDLPVGEYLLGYVATDVCSNDTECLTYLTVVDDAAPFAICDGYTQIALTSNGIADLFASSIDDESFDNCGNITMEIAKMTDECGWGLDFGPKVHFCCEEVGDSILVAFRVTDEAGLSNTCMVTVFVEDKLPPMIECPTDLTITCSYVFDPDDLSIFGSVVEGEDNVNPIIIDGINLGSDGYFEDNCEATVSEEFTINLDCGAGTITRTFTATDPYDQSASCTQTITIVNDDPFLENDINWPSNYEMNGCDTIQAMPSITGEPTWQDNKCALVASTYEDQIFYISGGACIKILREWTVIDWCQYEPGQSVGIWTYLQEIKLKNNIAPVFLDCEDKDICSYDEDCTSELVTITAIANDDCTDSLNLLYLWRLDLDDDGTIDDFGQGISFSEELLFGDHRVFWTVEDGCGNSTDCDYKITVRDCKNPTPYCISSITTTIMPSAGMIQVWASDFDYGSYDNCTAPEDLIFSFSQDIDDNNRIIVCDDIVNGVAHQFTFEMWVTDEHGNQERCDVTFIVQDNADVCNNGTIKGKIGGKVTSQHNKQIPDVEIEFTASVDTFSGMEMTDTAGVFTLDGTPEFLKYVFRPKYESNPYAGVSTLDLVMVQRHILDIQPFDNPYDIIASEVSGNDKVSSSDLVTLRKMILGIIDEWPKNQDNWVFVDSSYVFPDETDPHQFPDSIIIEALQDTAENINFVAVKMGDVNGSYAPNLTSEFESSATRNDNSFPMYTNRKKDKFGNYEYVFKFDNDEFIDGLQFSLPVPSGTVLESSYLVDGDYVIMDDVLKVSWINTSQSYFDEQSFFTLRTTSPLELAFTDELTPEIYVNLQPMTLTFEETNDNTVFSSLKVVEQSIKALPAAFQNDLHLKVQSSYNNLQLDIIDSNGRNIFTRTYNGERNIVVPLNRFYTAGIYFVKAIIDGEVHTLKVLHI